MAERGLANYLDVLLQRGDEVACSYRHGYRIHRWTCREIVECAWRFARELDARGVAPGERVLLWGGNSPEWVAAFWGCVCHGAVAVPMDQIAAPDFARRVSREVKARFCICSREFQKSIPEVPSIAFETLREALAGQAHQRYEWRVPAPDSIVEIVFTSGTTTDPKGVVLTRANLLANIRPLEREIQKYLKWERLAHPLRILCLLPLSHVFGQFLGIFVPILLRGSVLFMDSLNPAEVLRTIRSERISVLAAVPRMMESLREKVERDMEAAGKLESFRQMVAAAEGRHFLRRWWQFRDVHRLFGWKFWAFVSGGAALDADLENFWRRVAFAVVQGYGMTETTSLITVNHPFRLGKGSIGKPLSGNEIKVSDDGEILVRSNSVAAGYWKGGELRPILDDDGWLRTGDRAEIDALGNFFFKGRTKEVIVNAEGLNIYPADLEAALKLQPEVRDCVVVGFEKGGNAEPCAALILRDGADATAVVRRANQTLAAFQQIRRWIIWPDEDFPRNTIQKPKTREIQAAVQSQLASKESAAPGTLYALISRVTGRVPAGLAPQSKLGEDLNLSSLDRVELLSALEDRYQIDLTESQFAEATTVQDLERMLRQPATQTSDYSYPRWTQRWPVTWIRFSTYYLLTWPATVLLGYPRVRGRENLRGMTGPALVVSNHITSIDIGFILAALPARFRHRLAVAMLGERLQSMRRPDENAGFFKRLIDRISYALVVSMFNVFPLPQQAGFRRSFAYAGECVDRGYSVVVFPEGHRSEDGKLAHFRTGIGILADNLGIPVVPVRIDGLFELKKAGKRATRPGAVRVTIGSPLKFESGATADSIAAELEGRVRSLEWKWSTL